MQVWANDGPRELTEGCSLGQALASWGFDAQRVVVELNARILEREAFAATLLKEGDRLEIVRFLWGG